jgi:hypothetical protein
LEEELIRKYVYLEENAAVEKITQETWRITNVSVLKDDKIINKLMIA